MEVYSYGFWLRPNVLRKARSMGDSRDGKDKKIKKSEEKRNNVDVWFLATEKIRKLGKWKKIKKLKEN